MHELYVLLTYSCCFTSLQRGYNLYPDSIAAKISAVSTLSALLTEKAWINQGTNTTELKVTRALDKIVEKIKEDACAWVR